jgi:predicted phage tail protein
MERKVYLVGDIGDKFGRTHSVHADSFSDIMKCIEANNPTLKSYLLNAHEAGVGFTIEIEGKAEEHEEDLLLPLKPGDVTISAIPAGSKSGGMKIFAALVLTFFVLPMIGGAAIGGMSSTALGGITATSSYGVALQAGMMTTLGKATAALALNLAMTGMQQLMAPDPSVDNGPENYLFNGSGQNIQEGDPVPLLYGELRVPGRPMSVDIRVGEPANNHNMPSLNNDISSLVFEDANDIVFNDLTGIIHNA